jgi:hypothetical protein
MNNNLKLAPLTPDYFDRVIELGNRVHGAAYLTLEIIAEIDKKSRANGVTASFIMLDCENCEAGNEKVIGFRLTYAAGNWQLDEWCSPEKWELTIDQLCYFKSSTVDADYRGCGVAKKMLYGSVEAAKQQGALGGICHTWMQSPGNAAYHYFINCGGQHLETYPDRWLEDSIAGYRCVACLPEIYCHCDAGEMILYFDQLKR